MFHHLKCVIESTFTSEERKKRPTEKTHVINSFLTYSVYFLFFEGTHKTCETLININVKSTNENKIMIIKMKADIFRISCMSIQHITLC